MAAGSSPTISTFLELRDNMSAGLKSVTAEIDRLNEAAKKAEDAIRRLKAAQGARPSGTSGGVAPPSPPRGPRAPSSSGAAGPPRGGKDSFLRFEGGVFNAVTRANLLVDAIENAVVGATRAVAGLLKYTVKVGEEYEKTQLRITNSLVSMNLAPSMQSAAAGASDIMSKLREMAAKLPGEAKDYYGVFAQALPDAIASGMTDIKKYTEFAGKYAAVAMSRMVDSPQAGRDLQEMLQGRAHLRTKTYQELRTYIGMIAKDFNKLAPEKRMALLMEAVTKASGGMAMAATTANAKFGELKSRIEEIFVIGGSPFFAGVKAAVTDLNTWLSKNKEKILDLAETVSTVLGRAFRGIETIVESIGNKLLATGKTTAAGATYEQLDKRREEIRRMLEAPFSVAELNPKSWAKRAMLYGEMEEITEKMGEMDKTLARVTETKDKFRKTELLYRPSADISRATPEVQLMIKWRTGFFDSFERMGFASAKEAFDRYAESMGLTEKQRFELWNQMVGRGDIQTSVAPTTVREMKVEFNNNRFDIHQQFAEGFDPDRIAVAFASDLARAGEMKVQSAFSPVYGAGQ